MELGTIEWTVQLRFIVALALGFLVGLERESIKVDQKLVFGGVRTHPIISMFGFGCAWLYQIGATAMLPVGLLAIATLTGIAYVAKIRVDRFGTTSEVSALLTFITGALAMLVDVWIAMALGVMNTMLLSEKAMLESYVERLSKVEFLATVKFILVTVIILPVLPNHEFTQFHINPFKIWQIVIIVSTLGFVGYLLEKKFGSKLGLWMSGIFGGIVSSTAVTLSMGQYGKEKSIPQQQCTASSIACKQCNVFPCAGDSFGLLIHRFFRISYRVLFFLLLSVLCYHYECLKRNSTASESEMPGFTEPI